MTENMEAIKRKKKNIRLYLKYKMLSNDLLFFYAIDFLFLTQIKGFDVTTVVFAETIYTLFRFIFQIPCTILVDRLKTKKALIIGNISVAIYVLLLIFANNYSVIILANIFSAFGFALKSICGPSLLYDLLPEGRGQGNMFSKIDGKGMAYYYILYAITSLIAGFLFVINGYIPVILTLLICIYSIYIVFKFKNLHEGNTNEKLSIVGQLKELRSAFIYIFRSKRLSILITFYSIVSGFMYCFVIFRKSLMADVNISAEYFGIIFTVLGIISSIASANQNIFHKKFKNKTLSRLSNAFIVTCIISGIIVILNLSYEITVLLLMAMFVIQYIVIDPFSSLTKRYLGNFSTSTLRVKIYSATDLIYNAARGIIGLVGTVLLSITNTANTVIILSSIIAIIVYFILKQMKTRVGLRPEEYNKTDIEY